MLQDLLQSSMAKVRHAHHAAETSVTEKDDADKPDPDKLSPEQINLWWRGLIRFARENGSRTRAVQKPKTLKASIGEQLKAKGKVK